MRKKIWTKEKIQNHILERQGKEALNSGYYASTYPKVFAAAERTFGSWCEAIESCGIDYNTVRKYKKWTKESVLDEVRRLAKANEPLNSQYAQNNYKPLYMAAIKNFKKWGRTLTRAGIKYEDVRLNRSMSEEEIKEKIRALHYNNENLSYTNMRKNHQHLLAAAIKKLGNGSWPSALLKCYVFTKYIKK